MKEGGRPARFPRRASRRGHSAGRGARRERAGRPPYKDLRYPPDDMYTHENFAADVARNFEFLESDYGMRKEPLHVAGPGAWAVYANEQVKVVIELEVGGSCGVSVSNLRHVKRDPLERSEFDL